MGFVDDVLDEFDGQLSISDIYSMTYKELGYLREHRKKHHPNSGASRALARALAAPANPAPSSQSNKQPRRRK